jgi:Excreted virulence factor EspC, type VII ESX diderm
MDFEVAPVALRRGSADMADLAERMRGDLSAAYHSRAPDRFANAGWAASDGTDEAAAGADAALAAAAGRARDLGESLRAAAIAYERADEHAAGRLRW